MFGPFGEKISFLSRPREEEGGRKRSPPLHGVPRTAARKRYERDTYVEFGHVEHVVRSCVGRFVERIHILFQARLSRRRLVRLSSRK